MPIDNFKVCYNERRHNNNISISTSLESCSAPKVIPEFAAKEYPGSCVIGDKGRLHYDPMYSKAQEWKCSMKQSPLSRAYGQDIVERGKKPIRAPQGPQGSEFPNQRKHHIPLPDGTESSSRRGQNVNGLCVGFTSMKHFAPRDEAPQYDMESYMNKKQRVTTIERMRNGIPVVVPGDRAFKKVEHEPGYYAKGGLIPGSSIQLRKSAKSERKSNTGTEGENGELSAKTRTEKRPTFREKLLSASAAYDLEQVKSLTVAGQRQGNPVPSWEQRTGMFLVKPEDEAY